jgi:hypothetical protein
MVISVFFTEKHKAPVWHEKCIVIKIKCPFLGIFTSMTNNADSAFQEILFD